MLEPMLAQVTRFCTRWLLQWQHLAAFDGGTRGTLTTSELEKAIAALAPQLPALADLESRMSLPLYAAVAARKLLFFHARDGRHA